jgi:uncharacterized repeat protein (TIGR01451 family)
MGGLAPAARAQTAVITEFEVGISPGSAPTAIAAGPDGNLWFTEIFGNRIGRITPAGVVTEFSEGISPPPQYSMSGLSGIAAGPDGNVWFTEGYLNRIGRITPSGIVTEFSAGITPASGPVDIAAGPDGNLWFTEGGGNRIGRITPSGIVTEFSAGITPASGLGDIAAGPDGNLWFTEGYKNQIGRITPSGVVTEFPLGIDAKNPRGIAAGSDGNLWVRNLGLLSGLGAGIARITPSGVVTFFSVQFDALGGSGGAIAAGPDGNIWFIGKDSIGRITPSGVVTEFSAGIRPFSGLGDIAAGPDGNIWFTMQWDNRIGRLTPPGPEPAPVTPAPVTPQLPPVAAPTAIPAPVKPLTLKIEGAKTVRRGKRAAFVYRITNTTTAPIRAVVVTNTLPKGLSIDAISRKANRKVKRALRFTGVGRKVIFRLGTIAKGKTLVLRVNAKVAANVAKGKKTNTVVFWGKGVRPATVTSKLTIT